MEENTFTISFLVGQYSRTVAAKPSNQLYQALASTRVYSTPKRYLERTLFSRFELPSSVMSSLAQQRVKGCGKTGQTFTLYHISIFDGSAHPLAQGFKNLACGSCASTFQKMTYGIVLCPSCADLLGFPPLLVVAQTESAKPSRA